MSRKKIPDDKLEILMEQVDLLPWGSKEKKRAIETFAKRYDVTSGAVYSALRKCREFAAMLNPDVEVIKGIAKSHDRWNRFLIDGVIVDFHLFNFLTGIKDRSVTVAGLRQGNCFEAYGYIIPGKEDFMMGCNDMVKKDEAFYALRHLLKQ